MTGTTLLDNAADLVATTGAQDYDGAVTVNAVSANLQASTVSLGSTLDGATDLTVTGDAVFNDEVGSAAALSSLHVTGTTVLDNAADLVATTGAQDYDGAVTVNAVSANLQASTVSLGSTLDGATDLTVTGDAVFNDEVGSAAALSSLHVTGTTVLDNAADLVATTGAQDYDGAVTVNAVSANLQASTVSLGSTLDGATDLTVTGDAVFNDEVGSAAALSSLHVTGTTVLDNAADLVATTGAQDYDGAVTVNAVSANLQASTVSLGSTLDGATDLTVTGDAVFNDEVGSAAALSSLHVTGTTVLDNAADLVATTGAQDYDGAVTVNAVSANLQASTVSLGSTLDGATDLTVTGDAVFNDEVGGVVPLECLHVTGTSTINTSLVRTTGCQTYDGDVTTLPTTVLDGHPVTFNGTLNGSPAQCAGSPPAGAIVGAAGNSTINGTNGDDVIFDLSGNSTINGKGGNDLICTGPGNDKIDGGAGNDTIVDTGGKNDVKGGDGVDQITTGSGDDTIDGGAAADTINAGNGANNVKGGDGNDAITAGSGNDTIDGGSNDDVINAGDGRNNVKGGSGNDQITTGSGNDTVDGGSGLDTCNPGGGTNSVKGCEA